MPGFKSIVFTLFGTILLCSSAAAKDNLYRRIDLPSNIALKSLGLELSWWNQANIVPRISKLNHLSVDERRCYTLSSSGDVTAFDSETGKRLWANRVSLPNQPNTRIISNKKYAMFTAGSFLFALDYKTGDRVFQVRLPRSPSSNIIVDDEKVYMTGFEGSVYALSLDKIETLYKQNLLPQWSNNVVVWRYNTSSPIPQSAVSIGDKINVVSSNRSLYSVSASDRKLNFQMETDAKFSSPLGQFQEFLYASTEDYQFYCINTENGKIEWEFTSIDLIYQKPIVVGKQLFLIPRSGGVICLSASTGKEIWWQQEGKKFMAASKTKVYVLDQNDHLMVLSRETGEILNRTYMQPYNIVYSNPLTDRIFLAANTGLILSVHEEGAEFPTYHLRPEKQPILPTFASEEKATPKSDDKVEAEEK